MIFSEISTQMRQHNAAAPQSNQVVHSNSLSRLGKDVVAHIFSFLKKNDLRALKKTDHSIQPAIEETCRLACRRDRLLPQNLPPGITYSQFFLNRFRNAIDPQFWRECVGKVENVLPIPRNYIDNPRPGCKLVYIPDYITIDVEADSSLVLDETTAIDDKHRARLVEDSSPAPGVAREIKVPITPNNIILLAQKYRKKNASSQFDGMSQYSWQAALDQNGDTGVLPHWSYQQEALIGFDQFYHQQKQEAASKGLEIVPFIDRLVFDLFSYIQSGKAPQSANTARTATPTLDENNRPSETTISWPPVDNHSFHLLLSRSFCGFSHLGAAAGVPPEV